MQENMKSLAQKVVRNQNNDESIGANYIDQVLTESEEGKKSFGDVKVFGNTKIFGDVKVF